MTAARWLSALLLPLPLLAGPIVAAETPAAGPPQAIGGAAAGCLQGARPLPASGPGWQVLRPFENRFWGMPQLISVIETHAGEGASQGMLLIGDMSLPRGGRMPTGHASHQTGLDADILFRLAEHPLTPDERDSPDLSPAIAGGTLLPERWGAAQEAMLRRFAQDSRVERVFVNPVIKRHLCASVTGDRGWLRAIRPWWGHAAHFHVRLACPANDADCVAGPKIPEGDGCGADLAWWFSQEAATTPEVTAPPHQPYPRYRPGMPAACKRILKGY